MKLNNEQRERLANELSLPWGRVDITCDGFRVTLADAYNKTISASKRILPETNELAVAMGVVQRLAAFIKEQHPKHVGAFAEVLGPFGDELARAYG